MKLHHPPINILSFLLFRFGHHYFTRQHQHESSKFLPHLVSQSLFIKGPTHIPTFKSVSLHERVSKINKRSHHIIVLTTHINTDPCWHHCFSPSALMFTHDPTSSRLLPIACADSTVVIVVAMKINIYWINEQCTVMLLLLLYMNK